MHHDILKSLYENKDYYKYLKENSYWVNILRKHPEKYKDFIKFIKEKYQLRLQDKVFDFGNKLNVLSEVLSSIN